MSKLVKYPRTMNFPWSDSNSSDDVWWTQADVDRLIGRDIVTTEKLDGECTTMYSDHIHARSMDSGHHPSRAWVKKLHGTIAHEIPKDWRVCGENLYAYHSVFYTDLPGYFFVFGIYDDKNRCLSWDDTLEMCELLGLQTAPVIYRGPWDEKKCRGLWQGQGAFPTFATDKERFEYPKDFQETPAEGYVVRLTTEFGYEDFRQVCAKYVRPNHVCTPTNWMTRPVYPNLLRSD